MLLIAWQYSTMVKRKSKLSGKKRASKHGGGCRAPPKVMTAPPQPAAAISAVTSGSDSDDSELNMNPAAKASKAVAGASPRASSLATPRASEVPSRAPSPPPARLTSGEKELRKQLKKMREIERLTSREPSTLDARQQEKVLLYGAVKLEIERLQAALAAAVVEPEGAAEGAGEEQEQVEDGDAGMAQFREHGGSEASSDASGSSSRASSALSLGSVVAAAAGEPSEFYEEPPPPTPPQPAPPLRRSAVEAGASAAHAYSEQECHVRQIQASFRRKTAQRRRRAREAASQAASEAFSLLYSGAESRTLVHMYRNSTRA